MQEMTMAEILSVVNSAPFWILCGLLVGVVVVQSALFVRLSFREADKIGYPKPKLKTAMVNGAVTAVGPALAGVAVMIGMMAVVGSPITWQRLSIIGAPQTELTAAQIGAGAMGQTLGEPGFTLMGVALAFLVMAVNGSGWLLFCTVATPSLGTLRQKLSGGDTAWLALLSVGATLGLFSNLAGGRVLMGADHFTGVVVAFATQFLIDKYIAPKAAWIKGYAITFALAMGIIAAAIVGASL